MADFLLIDDDLHFCDISKLIIEKAGHSMDMAHNLKDGLKKLHNGIYDAIFLDQNLPDGFGPDIIPQIRKKDPVPEIIIITGYGDSNIAQTALQQGVWDYIAKNDSLEHFQLVIQRLVSFIEEKTKLKSDNNSFDRKGIIGNCACLNNCLHLVALAAPKDVSVLLTGETGTGKELFARAIHANSLRAKNNFVPFDCGSTQKNLIQSALFGHVKGAFTGAIQSNDGLLKRADNGTLFMDEIGELPFELQKTFLRLLQEKSFRLLGSAVETNSDFRLIASTNKNLKNAVGQGMFREDLFHRINTVHIELPPLRERREDIEAISEYYLKEIATKFEMSPKQMAPEFLETLLQYHWPGNVRELVNALEHSVINADSMPTLIPHFLPLSVRVATTRNYIHAASNGHAVEEFSFKQMKQKTLEKAEAKYLKSLIEMTEGNIALACEKANLSRSRLYDLLKKHNIKL